MSQKNHYQLSSQCSLPKLSSVVRLGSSTPVQQTLQAVLVGHMHAAVAFFTSAGLMTSTSSGFTRVREEKLCVSLTWHANYFYLHRESADERHYMPADKKEPDHPCCKAGAHP